MDIIKTAKRTKRLLIAQIVVLIIFIASVLIFIKSLNESNALQSQSDSLLTDIASVLYMFTAVFFGGVSFIHGLYAFIRRSLMQKKVKEYVPAVPNETLVKNIINKRLEYVFLFSLIEMLGLALILKILL